MEKYKIGSHVFAVKEGIPIEGHIITILPECEYEIETTQGELRIVDHSHINISIDPQY